MCDVRARWPVQGCEWHFNGVFDEAMYTVQYHFPVKEV